MTYNAGSSANSMVFVPTGNTYTGGTILSGGKLGLPYNGSQVFGPAGGTVTINSGQLYNVSTSGSTLADAYNYAVQGSFTLGLAGQPSLDFGSTSTWTINADATVTTLSSSSIGILAGSHNLTAVGAATLAINGVNTSTGTLNVGDGVNPGTVAINGVNPTWAGKIVITPTGSLDVENNNALGTSTVTVNGGTLGTFSGYNDIAIATAVTYNLNASFNAYASSGRSLDLGSSSIINLNAPITVTLTNGTGSPAVIFQNVAGGSAGALNVAYGPGVSSGYFVLGGGNTFTGTLYVGTGATPAPVSIDGNNASWGGKVVLAPGGDLTLGNSSSGGANDLGTSTVTINGGTVDFPWNGTTIQTAATYVLKGDFSIGNATNYGSVQMGPGTYNLAPTSGKNITITTLNGGNVIGGALLNGPVLTGTITDGGNGYGITVVGAGALWMIGTNSFTGLLQVGTATQTGSVILAGNNQTWNGKIDVAAGSTLNLGGGWPLDGSNSLGTSTLTIEAGADLRNYGGGNVGTATVNLNGDFDFNANNGRMDFGASTINLNAPITITLVNSSSEVDMSNVTDGGRGYCLTVTTDGTPAHWAWEATITSPGPLM